MRSNTRTSRKHAQPDKPIAEDHAQIADSKQVKGAPTHSTSPDRGKAESDTTQQNRSTRTNGVSGEALVSIAQRRSILWRTPGSDPTGYATVELKNGRRAHYPIRGNDFRGWLLKTHYDQYGTVPKPAKIRDTIELLSARAVLDGKVNTHTPLLRIGGDGTSNVWLDLADDTGRTVKVTVAGWEIKTSQESPQFIRRPGMQSLPEPVRGGTWSELRKVLNAQDDDIWVLIQGWLLGALRPCGPYPILIVEGEQGSAKSTLCRILRALIDPNDAPLRRPPNGDRDLMIAASNSWIVALDNLSVLSPELSDSLCSLVTGGGFATRRLGTDDEERLFTAARPVMINGIDSPTSRLDFLDRSIRLSLPTIREGSHRSETQLWQCFEANRGLILGCLLDAVVEALKNQDAGASQVPSRMADYVQWVIAAEPALEIEVGSFLGAYSKHREATDDWNVEASPVGLAIVKMVESAGSWSGTASKLMLELPVYADEVSRKRPDWPKTPQLMASILRRLSPGLRRFGVEVSFLREGRERRRIIELRKSDAEPTVGDGSTDVATASKADPENSIEAAA